MASATTNEPRGRDAARASYHHGHLRATLMAAALEAIADDGPMNLSLRDLARRAGVSHAAPAHHFGDKAGLMAAIAAEGWDLLADTTGATWEQTADFLEVGVAYVRFATTHPAHFAVMFRPDLFRGDHPGLTAARARARAALVGPAAGVAAMTAGDTESASLAAWSLMHGLATLWLGGNLSPDWGADPEVLARAIGRYLFITGAGQPTASE